MMTPSDLNSSINDQRLVWIDCEMTGLDPVKDKLLEIACIITEGDLKVVAEYGPICIKQPSNIMEQMIDIVKEMHERNGLLKRVETEGIEESEAENKLLEFVKLYTPQGKCPLSGNSVHADRQFLLRYMPKLCQHLHCYRIVDVSSIKELINRWYINSEDLTNMPPKKLNHLALDDIRESIEELSYYKKHFFVSLKANNAVVGPSVNKKKKRKRIRSNRLSGWQRKNKKRKLEKLNKLNNNSNETPSDIN